MATRSSSISGPSGYLLVPLRETADFTLCRGRQNGNSSSVLAVALAAERESTQGLKRLEHEYSLAAELDSAWAAKPLTLTRHEGQTILLLEDPGGEPLDRILQRDQGLPLDLTRFLRIAIGLSKALDQVHRQGLIHKDIKPENVLVDDAGNVWLTGFGIASQLRHERQPLAPPEIIAGTLAYMAPEQTGRMNRSLDSRGDLYSLGVTLYQMLTGALPFEAVDAMEWVHCHIARQPTPLDRNAEIPAQLSTIILRLLAKTAEERYQTAGGLEADLQRCLSEWEGQGQIKPFPLGAFDIPNRLLIPEKLYGREREVNALLAAFDRVVARGTPEMVLISGYSGIGKSSVVNELHKALVPQRGLFASGKFDQYKRDIPYATLAQAFQTLVRQILLKSEEEVDHWRGALQEALGQNGQMIIDLIPEVEFILGKQPPVPDMTPRDAQNRFQLVFRRFVGAFARPEHPLALFFDDLQWLDAATLDFLEELVTHSQLHHLLLVGAYRDNEVSLSHPLTRTLDAIRQAGMEMEEIVLAPLGLDNVGQLVADALHCKPDTSNPLAQLVLEKTGGNPFFVIQFFTALADEGLLWLDPVSRTWEWDMHRIRAKSYSDNVVDLMAGKLKRLPFVTQESLKQLACLGNFSEVATLVLVEQETEETVHKALWEAVRAGLIFQQESSYKFLHDRIQQAAYCLIPEEQRAEVHLRIGRRLLSGMTEDELTENLFDVANQFNRGAELLIDLDEKAQVATIDLQAGRKAKASAAYVAAGAYFSAAMALLNQRDWNSQPDLAFSVWRERAECELLTGNYDMAEQLIVELLQRGASKVDQAAIYRLKIQLHEVKGEYPQAVASGLLCLKLFGIDIPAHPSQEQVQAEYETVWQALKGRPIESLIDLPLMTDPEVQAATQVLTDLTRAAYFTDSRLGCLQICLTAKIALQHGTSGASTLAYVYFGTILGPVFHRYTDGYRFAKLACDLIEKHGFIAWRAKIYHTMGHLCLWTQPIARAIEFTQATFRTAIETGDLAYACYGILQPIEAFLLRNDPLDAVWRESEIALEFVRKTKYRDVVDIIQSEQRFIATMQGRTETFSTFNDAQFDEATFEAQMTGDRMALMIFLYWMLKLKARFLAGNYAEALAAADKAKLQLWSSSALIHLLDYVYYSALTLAACYQKASTDQQPEWRELLAAHLEQLREWAETYPPTFGDKHALVAAEIARLEGRDSDAMHLYEHAIQLAREHGFVQNEALSYELAARYYLARGFETIGHAYLRNARNCYDRWGALGKVKQLDELYPQLQPAQIPTSPTATIGTPVGQLDVETVVKASQALSSEIVLSKLVEKLLRIAVEHAGAERGLLICLRGDELQIEADAATGHGTVEVTVRQRAVTPSDLPQSALHYVLRTRDRVVLNDASVGTLYSDDEYVQRNHPKSVLCLPIVQQKKLAGVLYLENNLTPCAFTADRLAILELLASQAAISLENATLYSDLQREGQNFRLIVDTVPGFLCTMTARGEVEFVNQGILDYTGWTLEHLADWRPLIHPDEREMVMTRWIRSVETGDPYDIEHRIRGADGVYRWFHVRGLPVRDTEGRIVRWYNLITDIDERRKTHEKLQRSEAFLAQGQSISHTGSFGFNVSSGEIFWSDETRNIFEYDRAVKPTLELVFQRIHPDDRDLAQQTLDSASEAWADFDFEHRLLMPDGSVKHLHVIGRVSSTSFGNLEYVGAVTDVTAAKTAEGKIRQSEMELRQILDFAPQHVAVLGHDRDRTRLYANQAVLDYFGLTLDEWRSSDRRKYYHPDDWERLASEAQSKFLSGLPHEYEARFMGKDGKYRWFLFRWNPLRDEQGQVKRWYATATDIDDRKHAEQRLQNENVALREEITKASMFEEIVGTSLPLQTVVSRISKVAPSDSSVLITGETGTGKELVARAIHRRSRRSPRAFVCVNCAAIPRDLIASELFGHEKGAFTGATQRRLGRFELAEGGTLFLDEVGELPTETQIALLRVLQEHEFERVGGTASIKNDVRVIAATNRDLEAAIAAGTFRSDLFYRLNVFPIEIPSLRERRDDIPLLVEYFIDRFARKAGKTFHAVNKRSLDLLQSYPWPGNIRELQNVIERSVIICETENFLVDESWLSRRPPATMASKELALSKKLPSQEKAIIESALIECGGRVSGPLGAAAKLGIPGSTLESKIKLLKIDKNRFKIADPSAVGN
jgi:PAS domain S-box-containing protein